MWFPANKNGVWLFDSGESDRIDDALPEYDEQQEHGNGRNERGGHETCEIRRRLG
jgi:hypothetical protein